MNRCDTEELYSLHRERLLSLIQAKVEDTQKAEDLLHDSFIKLQTCCEDGCECDRPKSYLFRLALNTVYDYFKNRKKLKESLALVVAKSVELDLSKNDTSCDLIQCINEMLKDTSLENRIAFEQVDLLQQPQVQVATALNIPLPTLKSRVQRTRRYLKNRIEECCPDYRTNCI